jgi:hypothetical protein
MKMSEICTSNHVYRRISRKRITKSHLGAAKRLADQPTGEETRRTGNKHMTGRVKKKQQVPPLRYPGFPVEVGGVGELHAAFLTESRTRGRW